MTSVKRLRIFAGPNGSGKSSLIKLVMDLNVHLGVYVNADDIKIVLDYQHFIDFKQYDITLDIEHLKTSLTQTSFYDSNEGDILSEGLTEQNNCLYINGKVVADDKFPLFLADYIRLFLLDTCDKFTFETVMSHPSKLEYIRLAKSLGYRVYLFDNSSTHPKLFAVFKDDQIALENSVYVPIWFQKYVINKL